VRLQWASAKEEPAASPRVMTCRYAASVVRRLVAGREVSQQTHAHIFRHVAFASAFVERRFRLLMRTRHGRVCPSHSAPGVDAEQAVGIPETPPKRAQAQETQAPQASQKVTSSSLSFFGYTYTHPHIHTHTCIHTCIHTYIHTYIHTCMHTYIHTCVHTCIHTYTHTRDGITPAPHSVCRITPVDPDTMLTFLGILTETKNTARRAIKTAVPRRLQKPQPSVPRPQLLVIARWYAPTRRERTLYE